MTPLPATPASVPAYHLFSTTNNGSSHNGHKGSVSSSHSSTSTNSTSQVHYGPAGYPLYSGAPVPPPPTPAFPGHSFHPGALVHSSSVNSNSSTLSTPTTALPTPDGRPNIDVRISRVLDFLYLGSRRDAADKAMLRSLNIGYILNTTVDVPIYFPDSFHYEQIPIQVCQWVRLGCVAPTTLCANFASFFFRRRTLSTKTFKSTLRLRSTLSTRQKSELRRAFHFLGLAPAGLTFFLIHSPV